MPRRDCVSRRAIDGGRWRASTSRVLAASAAWRLVLENAPSFASMTLDWMAGGEGRDPLQNVTHREEHDFRDDGQ